jgi:hypothetical protein
MLLLATAPALSAKAAPALSVVLTTEAPELERLEAERRAAARRGS